MTSSRVRPLWTLLTHTNTGWPRAASFGNNARTNARAVRFSTFGTASSRSTTIASAPARGARSEHRWRFRGRGRSQDVPCGSLAPADGARVSIAKRGASINALAGGAYGADGCEMRRSRIPRSTRSRPHAHHPRCSAASALVDVQFAWRPAHALGKRRRNGFPRRLTDIRRSVTRKAEYPRTPGAHSPSAIVTPLELGTIRLAEGHVERTCSSGRTPRDPSSYVSRAHQPNRGPSMGAVRERRRSGGPRQAPPQPPQDDARRPTDDRGRARSRDPHRRHPRIVDDGYRFPARREPASGLQRRVCQPVADSPLRTPHR